MEVEKIRQVAKELDDMLETKNIDQILPFFADDCEVELLGVKLNGKEGIRKWLNWQYAHVADYKLEPLNIIIEGNVFFEEFVVRAMLYNGKEAESKQTEVLIYNDDYKVRSLRLYFDRLDFAGAVAKDPVSKFLVRRLIKISLKGLT